MLGVNWNKFEKPVEKPSLIKLYKHEDIDPMKMMDLILRELNILKELEPRVTLKITKLLNTVMHFRECAKCNKRFQDILPQILNRVQNLIKYVRKKSGKHYVWPNEYSYLRLTPNLPHACGIEEETQADEEKLEPIELGRLEKLDVSLVDDTPGVQISLLVEPEKADKRFYERVTSRVPDDLAAKEVFPIFHPQELVYNLVVVVLRSSSRTELHCKRKQGIFRARGFALAVGLISAVPWTKVFVAAVRAPVDSAVRFGIVGVVSYLRCVAPFEERTLVYTSNSVNSFDRLRDCQREICQKGFSDEVVPFRSTSSFGDDQDLIEDFLAAANEEDMEKVKDIEVEVKGLKDLMLEVHRNQIELSKVLLEKGVYSQPIVKLTDPRMLDEENRAVKNAAQFEVAKGSTSSETLQVAVDELKKKCDVKNRMILTLLRGLRSNVPKEWWEELVDCIFSETKPIEEFDSERVNEFIRQTSLYLMNGKEVLLRSSLKDKDIGEDIHHLLYVTFLSYVFVLAIRCVGKTSFSPVSSSVATQKLFSPLNCPTETKGAIGGYEKNVSDDTKMIQILSDILPLESSGLRLLSFPAFTSGTMEFTLKKLETQIAQLNAENDKLWNQINQLKEVVKQSKGEGTRKGSTQPTGTGSGSGRTINMVIRIGDKGNERTKDGRHVQAVQYGRNNIGKKTPLLTRVIRLTSKDEDDDQQEGNEGDEGDESDAAVRNEKLRALLQSKLQNRKVAFSDKILQYTPQTSFVNLSNSRTLVRMPSTSKVRAKPSEAGPSVASVARRQGNVPSTSSIADLKGCQCLGMFSLSQERELQTIPESDWEDSMSKAGSPYSMSEALQSRKTKKKMDDVGRNVENNQSLE
ncbi:hypothetical protein RUM43_007923 [Polyplax serrata]|uniref:Uncharacterized protein n=1 Tax=Polyplax serrata TaxID=468196 RepID=A0AAN8P9M8_POLSC